jgi:hypothetical protein
MLNQLNGVPSIFVGNVRDHWLPSSYIRFSVVGTVVAYPAGGVGKLVLRWSDLAIFIKPLDLLPEGPFLAGLSTLFNGRTLKSTTSHYDG